MKIMIYRQIRSWNLASENIRRNFFDIHKDMTKDFDVLTGAVSVMNQAEFYRERQIASSPGNDTFLRVDTLDKTIEVARRNLRQIHKSKK